MPVLRGLSTGGRHEHSLGVGGETPGGEARSAFLGLVRPTGIGVWATFRTFEKARAGEAAKLVEDLGFSTFWLGGSPRLSEVRPLLAATSGIAVGTAIVNIWKYEPPELAAEHAELTADFPGRLLTGIGIGHPEHTSQYGRPLATMRAFLDGLDAAAPPLPPQERCLSALAPRMLRLSAERSAGALPYFVPVEHTRFARETIGPDALLAVELACVVDEDPERARDKARAYAESYLRLSNYTNNLLRFGFTEQDIAGNGSARLLDAVVPQGSPERIAETVRAHLDAGADHVCVQPVGTDGMPRAEWEALARVLIA